MRSLNFDVTASFDVFRTRLKSLMESHNDIAAVLADECGMTRATLSRYLTGKRDPDIGYVIKLAQHYSVSIDWLLGLSEDNGTRYTPELLDVANKYLHASKDDKKVIDLILSKYDD